MTSDKNDSTPKSRTLSLIRTIGSTAVKAGSEALRRKMGAEDSVDISAAALRLTKGLDELKGAAMKLGQMLSIADDEEILPRGWKLALSKLQSEATPKDWSFIEPLLRQALGDLDKFQSIEHTAVHAASIGQVHRAILKNGKNVALKIRYPNLKESVHSDLENLKRLTRFANILPTNGNYDSVFEQVERIFLQELDFESERKYFEFYANAFKDNPRILVPQVITECCGEGVLATEWVDALNLTQWIAAHSGAEFEIQRNKLGTTILELILRELLELKTIQSDPNPANFLVTPEGRLVLLDFGATQKISTELSHTYRDLLLSCLRGTKAEVIEFSKKGGFLFASDSDVVTDNFVNMLMLAVEPFVNNRYEWQGCQLAKRIKQAGIKYATSSKMRAPPSEVIFVNRRILGNQMMMESLGPTILTRDLLFQILGKESSR
jgi:aarF domain-containing kinase